jgi:hypothetical protein
MKMKENEKLQWLTILAVVLIFSFAILYDYSAEHHYDGSYISRTLDGNTIYEDMSNSEAFALEKIVAGKQIAISKVDLPDSDLCGTFPFSPFTFVQIKGDSARIITYH